MQDEPLWTSVLKNNWYILIGIVVCLAGVGFAVLTREAEAPAVERSPVATNSGRRGTATFASNGKTFALRATSGEQVQETIAQHLTDAESDPLGEDTPAKLVAAGNLYRQKLLDYAAAANCYEDVIIRHKDWDGVRIAYLQLETCYEKLENTKGLRWLYEQMQQNFPADSQEHQYAALQLRTRHL
jgi:hypothetical protein